MDVPLVENFWNCHFHMSPAHVYLASIFINFCWESLEILVKNNSESFTFLMLVEMESDGKGTYVSCWNHLSLWCQCNSCGAGFGSFYNIWRQNLSPFWHLLMQLPTGPAEGLGFSYQGYLGNFDTDNFTNKNCFGQG